MNHSYEPERLEPSASPLQGLQPPQSPTAINTPAELVKSLDALIRTIKNTHRDPAWGHPDGLKRAASNIEELVKNHGPKVIELGQTSEKLCSTLTRLAQSPDSAPKLVLALTREVACSDAMLVALYVLKAALPQLPNSSQPPLDPKALIRDLEQTLSSIIAPNKTLIPDLLEDFDHEELAQKLRVILHDLEDVSEPVRETPENTIRLASAVEEVETFFAVIAKKGHPLTAVVSTWLKQREQLKQTLEAAMREFHKIELEGSSFINQALAKRASGPPHEKSASNHAEANGTAPQPEPSKAPSGKPQPPDLPKTSFLDEIEGLDEMK